MMQHEPELDRLARLLAASGADAKRFDRILRQSLGLSDDLGSEIAALRELQASVETGLDTIRRHQDSVLPAVGLTMSTFRSEARLYQLGFVKSGRLTNCILGLVVALQLLILACAIWMMAVPQSGRQGSFGTAPAGASVTIGAGPLLMHAVDGATSPEVLETGAVSGESSDA